MGRVNKCLKFPLSFLWIISLSYIFIGPVFAKTVTVTAIPFSGVAPLEVQLICNVATNTSAPKSYKMDFGDGSDPVTVETNQYSVTFTHTYGSGFSQAVCSVGKELGSP